MRDQATMEAASESNFERRDGPHESSFSGSVKLFGLDPDPLFSSRFLLPVFLHPGVEALACGSVTSAESQARNLTVRNQKSFAMYLAAAGALETRRGSRRSGDRRCIPR